MTDELERLRDVARAAAEWLRAEGSYRNRVRAAVESPAEPRTQAFADELYRLSAVVGDQEAELVRALKRLAEVNPDLISARPLLSV
ncbi:MAG TPA: hypothetical protein VKD90_11410 [Gemmataceae bacterium]|nr:hypothetical protein [Gemmataceae bacterium]